MIRIPSMKSSWTLPATLLATLVLTGTTIGDPCPDPDNNGLVNVEDLLIVLSDWGPCPPPGTCSGDLDENGTVGVEDLLAVIGGWGACASDEGDGPFNYGKALQTSILFYEAQRSGHQPDTGRLDWRGDSFMQVGLEQVNAQYEVDLRQRYMDAGDSPTFVLPISTAMTLLTWSGIEYGAGYTQTGQMPYLHQTLRWHADWCMAAHPEPNVFCGQIGQGDESHVHWTAAEVYPQTYTPKIWWLTPEHPGSEPTGETAAFLAAASILFRDGDPDYADQLLQHARELHDFADQYRLEYHFTITEVFNFYRSWTGYQDELCWSALWLYRATGEAAYLEKAKAIYDEHFLYDSKQWTHAWDDKTYGCMVLLSALAGDEIYRNEAEEWLDYWTVGNSSGRIDYTPGGLAWLSPWGSLRYAANTALMAFLYADLVGDKPDGRYRAFAEQQVNYVLGDNPRASSYLCGFGVNPPVQPHHRTAHGSWDGQIGDPEPNRHVLWGALVGGPASTDDFDYEDIRNDYIANEVACDYNGGIVGSLARMASVYGGTPFSDAEFPPVEDSYGHEMFVEASVIEDGETFTRLRCLLNNRSAWPARSSDALSYRIYVDLSEVVDAGLSVESVSAEASFSNGAEISDLQLADAERHLYFVRVDYDGTPLTPGSSSTYFSECQLTIGLDGAAPDSAWTRSNDPSLSELPVGLSAVVKNEMMPVYDAGVLVYGEEGVVDCNDNGIDDAEELADGAPDLDGNGVIDECDPDCNEDGVPDAWEIDQGASDCDGDGLPDECQTFEDCNSNGVGDACEIADGSALDCNVNLVPDACDIANGDAEDADGDGIPDSCQVEGLQWSMSVSDQWNDGFVAQFSIINNSGAPIEDWRLVMEAGFEIVNIWDAILIQDEGGVIELEHESWNATIPDGQSIEFGFQGDGVPQPPTSVQVNGNQAEPL